MLNVLEGGSQQAGVICCCTDGPTNSSAGCCWRTSSTSLTKPEHILDDNGELAKRVERVEWTADARSL
ncbi:hypothetical protein RB195_013324 [Necator americanus]